MLEFVLPHRHPQYMHPNSTNLQFQKTFEKKGFFSNFWKNEMVSDEPYGCMYGTIALGGESRILSESFDVKKNFEILKKKFQAKFW